MQTVANTERHYEGDHGAAHLYVNVSLARFVCSSWQTRNLQKAANTMHHTDLDDPIPALQL